MNFFQKHIHQLAGVFLLTVAVVATGWLYFDLPVAPKKAVAAAAGHSCAMHAAGSAEAGACPTVAATPVKHDHASHEGCAHAASPASHEGCAHGESAACCDHKPQTTLKLPPGHPPIPGYEVEAAPATPTPAPVVQATMTE